MKNYLMLALMSGAMSVGAQTLVGSGGTTHSNGSATVSTSVGEPAVFTHEGSGGTVSQGFQQGEKLTVTSVGEKVDNYDVFPNPTSSYVTLNTKVADGFSFTLTDFSGKELLKKEGATSGMNVHFEKYPAGVYFVKILSDDKKSTQTFKIIKR